MSSKGYDIKCRNDIISIPDVATGFKYARSWGCNVKGLSTKDQIIKVLLTNWDEKNTKTGKDQTVTNDALVTNYEIRKMLAEKYDEVLSFYCSLNESLQRDINSVFHDFNEELKHRRTELTSPDCFILVAGDRVSGKSSFINQMLGTDILPVQQLACTATICEIRHDIDKQTKKAILHEKDGKLNFLDLEEDKKDNFQKLKECIRKLDENDESPYDKIEILWPFEILKNGIILVDSPGICENHLITHRLEKYMRQSFGFIYIIDSAQAAGLQKGRLQDFLRTVANSTEDMLDPLATLFCCNKWDVVPEKERNDIRELTKLKLKKIFPELKEEQIFTVSTAEAAKAASFGSIQPEFKFLLENGIKKLIPASMHNKILSHYRWLCLVLKRVCYSLKVVQTLSAQWIEENSALVDNLKVKLGILRNEAEDVLKSAKGIVEEQIDLLHKEMANQLRSRTARDNICTWKQKDCPKQADYKRVAQDATEMIANRITDVINDWEQQNQFVNGLQETIVHKFEEECQLMEHQIQEVEGVLRISNPIKPSDIRSSFSVKVLWESQRDIYATNSFSGLGSAVSSAGVLNTSDKRIKSLFKRYKKEKAPEEIMMQASVYYIESIFAGQRLRDSLSKFLKRFIKGIDTVAEKIPDFIKADNELLWKTELDLNETRGALKSVYPDLLKKANKLQGQLDLLYATKFMRFDFSINDISWSWNDILGAGSFADVFKANLKVGSDIVRVALKISKDDNCITESNITDILREENTLRHTQHENLIKYYGSLLYEKESSGNKKLKWIMILEYCYDTLKNKLSTNYKSPSSVPNDKRFVQIKIMADYVIQLCAGLQYLHDKNLVHRDLKLENILLTVKNGKDVVKLTDVGLTKSEAWISGTLAGSPVYMAPEIILRLGIYDRKADIYSLGIILWEMWYGRDAAVYISDVLRDRGLTLEKALEKEKLRPSLELENRPSLELEDLIEKCWNDEPKKRLDARDVGYFFQTYLDTGS